MSFRATSSYRQLAHSLPSLAVLAVMLTAASVAVSDFATSRNALNLMGQLAPLAVVALGQTFVVLIGGIDLSVGATMSLATVLLATVEAGSSGGELLLVAGVVAVGGLVGLFNAVGVRYLGVHPLVMTFATSAVVQGVALGILPQPGGSVPGRVAEWINMRWEHFTMPALVVVVAYAAAAVALHLTRFGRHTYAMGSDRSRAYLNGVPVARVETVNYVISGALAAAAGVLLAARIYSGDPVIGTGYTLDSIAAVAIGGTSLSGGVGGVAGTLLGAVLLGSLNNLLNLLGVFSFYQYLLKGFILIGAVILSYAGAVRR